MATDEEKQLETSPLALKTTASLRDHVSQSNSSDSPPKRDEPTPKLQSEMEFIMSVASKLASQPLHNKDPQVWGVLTAISTNARKRRQGSNMLLSADEHKIGRLVMDAHFRIDSLAVSANHCKIYRKVIGNEASDHHSKCQTCVLLKDTSTNGTFINWKKLTKSDPEVNINHGDIISFAAAPHQDAAYSFVYREVAKATAQLAGGAAKRKGEELGSDIKRVKGIGIGSLEGPLSLDDFRSLQRSNAELRKQLEDQVSRIDALQNENRVAVERHEKDVKELKESISSSYIDQLKKLQDKLDIKQKELLEVQKSSAEQKHAIEDLNERLSASMQSCAEANEIMNSRKATIAELKEQLLEERDQRREERGKAGADLKAALQRAHAEAQEELKRLSDAATRRETEQQELINKLQETERERCSLLDSLRSKLEDTRQNLVISDNKVRQLEAQICEEQQASSKERERVEELEKELRTLRKELESEKAAREEAWAKVSTLELEISAAIHDLDFERRRLRGARERVLLRETQLRAFYSTTEEIMLLFSKQQEQLKAMQRTLEDEENYENTSLDFDLTVTPRKIERVLDRSEDKNRCGNKEAREGSSTSAPRCDRDLVSASTDEASVTEKHDCNIKSQEDAQYTQEADVTSANHNGKGGFGSEIDGVETEPVVEGDPIGTECVLETESLGIEGERNIDLNNAGVVAGETMQLDDGTNVQESADLARTRQEQETQNEFQLNNVSQNLKATQDTEMEMGATIRTTDLLASEVAGSWACSTAPSVHGENESQRSRGENEVGDAPLHDSNVLVAESQSTPSSNAAGARLNHEHRALTEMIGIVAPDLRKKFVSSVGDNLSEERENEDSVSNSDTEDYTESDHANESCKGGSDVEMDGSNQRAEGQHSDDTMGEDDDDTEEDSLG